MEPLLRTVGRRVRAIRSRRGLSRAALAQRASLSSRFLAGLEVQGQNISLLRLQALARALEVPLIELLGEPSSDPAPPRTIALLGLRGAGKSTVGPRLAAKLRRSFHELDAQIEQRAGLRVAEIFAVHGEPYYRRLEREALSQLLERADPIVVATSGGIVTDPLSFELLRRRCWTVWLKARPRDHWQRVVRQGDRRPMAQNPQARAELEALLAAREPLYAQADLILDTSHVTVHGVVRLLAQRLGTLA